MVQNTKELPIYRIDRRKNEAILGICFLISAVLIFVVGGIFSQFPMLLIPICLLLFSIVFLVSVYLEKKLTFYQDYLDVDSYRGGHEEILYSDMECTQLIPWKNRNGGTDYVFKVCKVGEEFRAHPLMIYDSKIPSLGMTLHQWLEPRTKSLDDFKARYQGS